MKNYAGTLAACMLAMPAFTCCLAAQELPSPTPVSRPNSSVVEAMPIPQSLSLDDFIGLALQNNPTLPQAVAAIGQAEGARQQVRLYPNPQLGYLRSDPSVSGQSRTNGVFLAQEIVTAGKRWKGEFVEAMEVNRLSWAREAQQQRVINDVRIRFYEVLAAQRNIDIQRELIDLAESGLKTAEQLHAGIQVPKTDVLQARIQTKTARLALGAAQARHQAAWQQLVNMVGIPEMQPVALAGTLDGDIPEFGFEDTFQRLMASSPQIQSAAARIDHARGELQRELAGRYPNVTLQFVAEHDAFQKFNNYSTLIAAPVPIFNRNQGNIAHAMSDVREAEAELRRTELALRDQLAETFRRYDTARNQAIQIRRDILPDAEESLKLINGGYRAGELSLLQVLAARQTYAQSRLAYVGAVAELRKVVSEVDGLLLTGGLNPAELGTALQSQPGGFGQQQGLLNQLQEGQSKQILPPALQTGVGP